MNIQEYLEKMKEIQTRILDYINTQDQEKNDPQIIIQLIDSHKIRDNKHELKTLLHLILKISNNYWRAPDFFSKIFDILKNLKNDIKKNFTNFTIFNLFKSNKRILLFLIEEEILTMDKFISSIIINKFYDLNYCHYFYPEIKPFIDSTFSEEILSELPENYEEKRKIGENEDFLCELIRNDKIEEFIVFVNKNNFNLSSTIKPSIFETNTFLIKNEPTLIEYAAFFGSIRIFNYLKMNKIDLESSLWPYAVHSGNSELINLLEENKIEPSNDYIEILNQSIKCHQIEISEYIQNNHIQNENQKSVFSTSLKAYNFCFIKIDIINELVFYDLCKYDYYILVEFLSKLPKFDANLIKVFKKIFLFSYRF